MYDDFVDFVKTKTNATVLRNGRTEADDLIARWIDKHPDQEHVIISTDKDLNQLITPRVKQYNGVNETTLTHEGWFDAKSGKPVIDKKLKAPKPAPDTEWIVFEKAMRGDPSDNIFSAYPGVRTKGTKNKIGLQEDISRPQPQPQASSCISSRALRAYRSSRYILDTFLAPSWADGCRPRVCAHARPHRKCVLRVLHASVPR